MVYGGMNELKLPRMLGRIPRVSTRFSLSVENGQAYAGREGQTRRETKLSGMNGDSEKYFFSVKLTTSRIDNLTRLIHTLVYVMAIHT